MLAHQDEHFLNGVEAFELISGQFGLEIDKELATPVIKAEIELVRAITKVRDETQLNLGRSSEKFERMLKLIEDQRLVRHEKFHGGPPDGKQDLFLVKGLRAGKLFTFGQSSENCF